MNLKEQWFKDRKKFIREYESNLNSKIVRETWFYPNPDTEIDFMNYLIKDENGEWEYVLNYNLQTFELTIDLFDRKIEDLKECIDDFLDLVFALEYVDKFKSKNFALRENWKNLGE